MSESPTPRALPPELDRPAWLHGLSAFTTVRTQHAEPLLWSAHLARLGRTCTFLGLPDPAGPAEEVAAHLTTTVTRWPEGRLRLTVTEQGLWWAHHPLKPVARRPVRIWLSEVQVHPQLGSHKTGNYLPYQLAAREAGRHGAFEGWLLDASGNVVDGSRSAVLLEVWGELLVPQGGLPSVTREALLLEWGRPYRVTPLLPSVVAQARRAWIMGSGIGVLPVAALLWPTGTRDLPVSWPEVRHPALQPPP